VYFIFKQKALAELLNVSESSIKRSIVQLKEYQLIESESTMTVNLYYITLEYQQSVNSAPPIDNFDPTIGCGWSNNSDTELSDTNYSKTDTYQTFSKVSIAFINIYESFFSEKHRLIKEEPEFYKEYDEMEHQDLITLFVKYFNNASIDKCNIEYVANVSKRIYDTYVG
jgi:hypothetical protein